MLSLNIQIQIKMASTQRILEDDDKKQQRLHDRSQTMHLEKILLSSSSTSSNNKIQTQSSHNLLNRNNDNIHLTVTSQHLQSVDNQSGASNTNTQLNGGQNTYRGGFVLNNTGKNWRKLITPAHDSFKKLQQMKPEYSGQDLGKGLNKENHAPNGAISNDTSMNSSDNYSSVQEFNPATNEMLQLRPFNPLALNTNTTNTAGKSMIEIEEASSSSSEEYKKTPNHPFVLPSATSEDHQKSQLQVSAGEFGTQSEHMKSLMKSFSNGNFGFYENLHKKYFDKAKQDESKSKQSQKDDIFTLTSKTGTLLGLSHLKQSIKSLKTSNNNSYLRASSLKQTDQQQNNKSSENQKTMSINFKNSLYKKINTTSVYLDDQSQMQSKINYKKKKDYFDTSSSSSEDDCAQESHQRLVTQDSRIRGRTHNVRRAKSKNKHHQQSYIKDNFEDDLIDDKFHSMLSRRDLSANNDDTQSHLDQRIIKTPRDFLHDFNLKNKQDRDSSLQNFRINNIPRHQNFGRDVSPNSGGVDIFYHQGLNSILSSSEQNQKMLSMMSHHQNDFIQQQNNDTTNVIFEQPTKEEEIGDTNGIPVTTEELRPEDLSNIIDHVIGMQSSQMSSGGKLSQSTNNDVLKTFQEYCKIARQRQGNQQFQTNQKKTNGLLNSQYALGGVTPALLNMNSDKQSIQRSNVGQSNHQHQIPQSAAPANRHQPLSSANRAAFIQTTNTKKSEHHLGNPMFMPGTNPKQQQQFDQRSDFTFVLSNPTDFECCPQCGGGGGAPNDQSSSFITQKHQMLLQNSSQQSFIRMRQQQRQMTQLPDIQASPIYSEQHQPCQNCGGNQQMKQQQKFYNVNQSIVEQPVEEANDQDTKQQKKVFEYKEVAISEEEGQEQQYQMEEEIKFLRLIMNVSLDYLSRILQDYVIAQPMRQELQKFTQLLNSLAVSQSQGSAAMQVISDAIKDKGQHDGNNNVVDANMTMSELQLQNDSQLGHNPKQVNETKLSELVVMGDDGDDHLQEQQEVNKKTNKKKLQQKNKEETGKFLSSLISQTNGEEGAAGHNQEDTVYSYLEEDESCSDEEEKQLRQSLKVTKKMLRQEKIINKEQQEMLKKMQAEIEALNRRWMMTEEKLKAGENAFNILSRTTTSHFNHGSYHNYRSAAVITPSGGLTSTIGSTQVQNLNTLQKRDVSPGQLSTNTPHMQSQTALQHQHLTPSSGLTSQHYFDQSQQPTLMVHLNERLTRQIEENLHLFDSLHQELSEKQAALAQGEAILTEKDREVRRLKGQLKTMDLNMKQLIEVTKLTSEATEASKARHRDEIDKIKRRQLDYQAKIQRIQDACGINDSAMTIAHIAQDSFMRESPHKDDSSALLKYSQDLTGGSQLVLSGKPVVQV